MPQRGSQREKRLQALTTKPKFKSDAFEAIHASASALHKVCAIDKATMRTFDEASLVEPSQFAPGGDQSTWRRAEAWVAGVGWVRKVVDSN